MEARMRIVLGCLIALAFAAPSAFAAEVNLKRMSADELKAVCQKAGGSFSTDNSGYGCGTDCKGASGTDCTVFCPANGKSCTAQTTGARRPKTADLALAPKSARK
jgi:hypothetical protein